MSAVKRALASSATGEENTPGVTDYIPLPVHPLNLSVIGRVFRPSVDCGDIMLLPRTKVMSGAMEEGWHLIYTDN